MKRLMLLCLALCACDSKPEELSGFINMACEVVGNPWTKIRRCYNHEAVCYLASEGITCWKVGQ